jgi:hypothetical protein
LAAPINARGAKSDKLWRDAIMRAVKRRMSGEGDPQALDKLADKCVDMGLEGDMQAIKEIGDRLDGRPAQAIIGGDEDDSPVKFVIATGVPSANPSN